MFVSNIQKLGLVLCSLTIWLRGADSIAVNSIAADSEVDAISRLSNSEFTTNLHLSEKQKSRIANLLVARRALLARSDNGERKVVDQYVGKQLETLLSPAQLKKWKSLAGDSRSLVQPKKSTKPISLYTSVMFRSEVSPISTIKPSHRTKRSTALTCS